MPYTAALQTLKAQGKAKSVKQTLFATYEQELSKMIGGVNDFVLAAGDACATAEAAEPDMDDVLINELEKYMITLTRQCEHHNLGAKAAKLRFVGMLG